MQLDFNVLYDPRIKCTGDMNDLLDSPEGRAFGVPNALQMIRAVMRIDIQARPEASREILKECKLRQQHYAAGPLLFRVLELADPQSDERAWIDELVEIMIVAYDPRSRAGLSGYLPLVAAGMFSFLEFRSSPNIEYFADKIIGGPKNRLGRNMMCNPATHPGFDLHPMYALLRESIERQTDLKSWVIKTIQPNFRKNVYNNTGFKEIIETMPGVDKGKALEDALGL